MDEEFWREHDRAIDDGSGNTEGILFIFITMSLVMVFLIAIIAMLSMINS